MRSRLAALFAVPTGVRACAVLGADTLIFTPRSMPALRRCRGGG
ncbi:MAG: hypothetical protein ACLFRZ_05375 [Rhodosalinus sp.]